jgi:hypothetical protein
MKPSRIIGGLGALARLTVLAPFGCRSTSSAPSTTGTGGVESGGTVGTGGASESGGALGSGGTVGSGQRAQRASAFSAAARSCSVSISRHSPSM